MRTQVASGWVFQYKYRMVQYTSTCLLCYSFVFGDREVDSVIAPRLLPRFNLDKYMSGGQVEYIT